MVIAPPTRYIYIYIYHDMLSRVSPTPVHSQAAKMDLECGTETAAQSRESGERCLRCGRCYEKLAGWLMKMMIMLVKPCHKPHIYGLIVEKPPMNIYQLVWLIENRISTIKACGYKMI